ncbi:SDR family NAD(P)-dependent oxidoreductase [Azonexus sp. IMCC34839]|uniref:SDR family NAD(P)-dependent oxidoreductase n=1 Tax=Azonexus sp. IMCC34839 TaxID=3133695 RepID=UPI00399B0C6C
MSTDASKACLITGAAGGIGRQLVREFQDAGFYVIATDKVEHPVNLACGCYLRIDLGRFVEDDAYAQLSIAAIRGALNGRELHALINNAAIQILGGVDDIDRQAWRQTMDVNLTAPFLLIKALLPFLAICHGAVVNIGSIHARLTKKNFVAYATSKAALAGLTRALAVDVGVRVRVNAIEPAAIETDMLKAGFAGKPELYQRLEMCHPLQRIGQAEEVARLALAIVGGGMTFLNGACIGLDGGISARLHDPD